MLLLQKESFAWLPRPSCNFELPIRTYNILRYFSRRNPYAHRSLVEYPVVCDTPEAASDSLDGPYMVQCMLAIFSTAAIHL